jgi:hypothetical protein
MLEHAAQGLAHPEHDREAARSVVDRVDGK